MIFQLLGVSHQIFTLLRPGWWLSHPSENMTSSVGIMKFPMYMDSHKIIFQTTNQIVITR